MEVCLDKAQLTPKQQKTVEAMTQAIIKKLLHQPTANLRQVALNSDLIGVVDDINGDHVQYVRALQELFALEQADDLDTESTDRN